MALWLFLYLDLLFYKKWFNIEKMLTSRKKKNVIEQFHEHATDTGSAAVQVALLTKQIEELSSHLKKHSKDQGSRRGLLQMVGKRRRLLRYLAENDERAYTSVSKKLGLQL